MHGFAVCVLVIAAALQASLGQLEQNLARIDDFLQSVARARNMRNPKIDLHGPQKQKLESRYAIKPSRQTENDVLGNGGYATVVMAAQHIGRRHQFEGYNPADDEDVPNEPPTTTPEDWPRPAENETVEDIPPSLPAEPVPVKESGTVSLYQRPNGRGAEDILPPRWPLPPESPIFPLPPVFPLSWPMSEQGIIGLSHPIHPIHHMPIRPPHPVPVIVPKLMPYSMAHFMHFR